MFGMVRNFLSRLAPRPDYRRKPFVVLINGLAEQPESWFGNRPYWEKDFDLKVPEILVYDGPVLARRIEEGQPISVPFLTDQLEHFLDNFVQTPPYHLVASSLGGQVTIEYAVRHPERVGRIVLICPSGFGGEEKLPVAEGMRSSNFTGLVGSVFHDRRFIDPAIVQLIERQFVSRQWRKGLLRTVRGTSSHSVRERLHLVTAPVLLICGKQDEIVDPHQAQEAIKDLPNFRFILLDNCGHAPQIEQAAVVNRLVREFLLERPAASPRQAAAVPQKPTFVP